MSPGDPTPGSRPSPETSSAPPDLTAAAVAHDLNQMLAVISGRLGLLLAREGNEDLRRHLRAMEVACRDAADLVRRLAESGTWATQGRCDPEEQARLAVELVLGGQDPPDAVVATVEGGGELAVALPAQILREVLVNLLTNAREAMGGRGRIRIAVRRDGGQARLSVADTGPGVAPEIRRALFRPGNSSRRGANRGIGLAGCRELLSRYGGRLDLVDGASPGAEFVLEVPLAGPGSSPRGSEAGVRSGNREEGSRLRVLVVDDEPAMRDMLQEVLPALGCDVTAVSDAVSAVREFRRGAFEVALLDENLPGTTGTRLAADLRRDDPCLAVILMSGWGRDVPTPDGLPGPIDFVVRKPMEFPQLQRLLMDAVRLHAGRSAGSGARTERGFPK